MKDTKQTHLLQHAKEGTQSGVTLIFTYGLFVEWSVSNTQKCNLLTLLLFASYNSDPS